MEANNVASSSVPPNNSKDTASSSPLETKKTSAAQKERLRPPKKKKIPPLAPSLLSTQSAKGVSASSKEKAAVISSPPGSSAVAAAAAAAEANNSNAKRKRRKKGQAATGEVKEKDDIDGGAEDPIGKIKLKVIVRKLPPNVPEAIFWKAVSPWITRPKFMIKEEEAADVIVGDDRKDNISYGYFVQGKLKDGSRRGINSDSGVSPHISSRAYIRFTSIEALIAFHRGFDGHLFRDAKGNESFAVVEFAPFQRMPDELVKRKKIDTRQGTIEEDADYKAFVIALEEKKADTEGMTQTEKTDAQLMSQLLSSSAQSTISAEKAKHTPLLDHLRAQRSAKAGSASLKNARSYLKGSNNAYAATTGKAVSSNNTAGKEKGKGKGKGKAKAVPQAGSNPIPADPSIPTGPKASRKPEVKGSNKTQGPSQQGTDASKSASSKGSKFKAKAQGGGTGAGVGKAIIPLENQKAAPLQIALLTKDNSKIPSVAPSAVNSQAKGSVPTGPAADRAGEGASRGRGRGGRRGARGRGGASNASKSGEKGP